MKRCLFYWLCTLFLFLTATVGAQELRLKVRRADAVSGKAFALTISDSTLSLEQREKVIFNEIKKGNIPNFQRKLIPVSDTTVLGYGTIITTMYVLPDYFSIGSDTDYFYVPMTPILAQKVAELTNCSLPTKKMVDLIYKNAAIKLKPQPIPPTKAMTTVPVFLAHTDSVRNQLKVNEFDHVAGLLTAGNKKDLIVSNKIYGEKTARVVIYGWHKLDGQAIQPVYHKHTNLWADYSHGIRLVYNQITIGGKRMSLKKVLKSNTLCNFLSDEGTIRRPWYPITNYR